MSATMQKRILCLWFPNWPMQRLGNAQPGPKGRILVLHAGDARGRQYVVAGSDAAAERGVQIGMPLAEAQSLASSALFKEHDPDADRAALERLALWSERFSPLVGLEEVAAAESLLLDVTGVAHLFGDEEALAQRLGKELGELGYRVQIAIADTVGAAWALAHFQDAAVVVAPAQNTTAKCTTALARLPLEALRLPAETIATLEQLGLCRIEHLQQLPRASLPARFPAVLLKRLEQLTGDREELITPHRPLRDFQAAWSLEVPTGHRATIEQVLSQLVHQLTAELAKHNRGAVQMECRLHGVGQMSAAMQIGVFRPSAEPAHWMELVRMQLESLALSCEVSRLSVSVIESAPLQQQQYELFTDRQRDDPQQLGMLIDRLSSRIGRDRVVRPQLQAAALPERTYRLVALTGNRHASGRRAKQKPAPVAPGVLQRPLRLLPSPAPVEMVCIAPEGTPARFHYQRRPYTITRHWGPERIETAWWRGKSVRRDYYRVECADGCRFWLFRRLEDDRWLLHGMFD